MKNLLTTLIIVVLFIGCNSEEDSTSTYLSSTSNSVVTEVNCCPFSSDVDNSNPGSRIVHTATFEGSDFIEVTNVNIEYSYEGGVVSDPLEVNNFDINYTSQSTPVIGSAGSGVTCGTVEFVYLWKFWGSDYITMTVNLTTNKGALSSTHNIERPAGAN